MPASVTVATLNLLNNPHGRWRDREPLVVEQAAALGLDVLCVQEVDTASDQVDRLAAALGFGHVAEFPNPDRASIKSLAILSRLAVDATDEHHDVGEGDIAGAVLADASGAPVWIATTHLLFRPTKEGSGLRRAQAERVLAWLGDRGPLVLAGDFNAGPDSPTVATLKRRYRSAYEAVHGREPETTHPTPLVRAVDVEAAFGVPLLPDAPGRTVDYVFVTPDLDVLDCALAFDRPSREEPALYPSDHFGLVATVAVP